jgi:hypothetical protein
MRACTCLLGASVRLAAENLALIPEVNTAAARFWWGTPPDDVPEMRGRKWDYVGKPVFLVCSMSIAISTQWPPVRPMTSFACSV